MNYESILIGVGSCIAFVLFWMFLSLFIATVGGWRTFAEKYQTVSIPQGTVFYLQSIKFNALGAYNNCITLTVSPRGLGIRVFPLFRVGHPPLLLPWRDIMFVEEKNILWQSIAYVQIGKPPLSLQIPAKVLQEATKKGLYRPQAKEKWASSF